VRNQIKGIWAADLFVVQTIGFQTLYVFLFISHERRELVHFNVTASPTAAWIWRQGMEATAWGRQPRYLIHDRDNVYGDDFGNKLAGAGIAEIRTPYRASLANAIAERVVRTFAKSVSITSSCSTRGIYSPYSRSSCTTTTMIDLIARSSWRHRCQVCRHRMATSLANRSWAAFITSMRGRHERCTYAALQ
jgi:hypothetical protein